LSKQVDFKTDSVHTWYPSLWKQKAMYHFYEVYDSFMYSFKKIMFGNSASRLSLEVATFLDKRGNFESNEQYHIIIFYCSQEAPFYLLFYVSCKIFMVEVCRQYRF
jgi:hypothetical protein